MYHDGMEQHDPPQAAAGAPPPTKADIVRYRANLKGEVEGVALYRALAGAESEPKLSELYTRFADVEDKHADFWRQRLRDCGEPVPEYRPGVRVRVLSWIARRFGVGVVLPAVRSLELSAVDDYRGQPEAEAVGMPASERSHARVFQEISRAGDDVSAAGRIAKIEGRHRVGGGNALRAAVLGANDGVVSNLSLVMGVAGADPGRDVVVLAGIAGLLAGSFSMAMGEWVSVQSSRELAERQLAIEAEELENVPEEETEELALIYEAKGAQPDQARQMAERIIADRATALETLGREELGIDVREIGSPWVAAGTSFVLFAMAAVVPVIPYFFGGGRLTLAVSLTASAITLWLLGAGTTLFTGRGLMFSGLRQMGIGLAAAAATFAIGSLVGASIGV